ncbi:hypothetical protein TIFTF001_013933 [Ficus carica]|uniref:Uncharacterized protein n=1 Tax=Ficus carica TaxID=3494 RepID=A0AA88D7Q8_FICCA|nr:hypothetical protein TIFTF001_013933 [Ficus carica]
MSHRIYNYDDSHRGRGFVEGPGGTMSSGGITGANLRIDIPGGNCADDEHSDWDLEDEEAPGMVLRGNVGPTPVICPRRIPRTR